MRVFRVCLTVVTLYLAAALVVSCAGAAVEEGSGAAEEGAEALRVAMVFPGKVDDQSFNQVGFQGLQRVEEELGAEISFSEEVPAAQAEEAFRDFASRGNNVVIGHGGEFEDAALKVADEFPDVTFAVINGSQDNGENYAGYRTAAEQWKFVAGTLAGLVTESNKVGYIAGICFPAVAVWANGARDGVAHVNPDAEFLITYTEDFADATKAQEAAVAMAGQGVDVIMTTLDEGVLGVIEGAEGSGYMIVPEWFDYSDRAPDSAIASSLMPFDELPLIIAEDVSEGTFDGSLFELTMPEADDPQPLTPLNQDLVPSGVEDEVEEVKQQVISGDVTVEPDPEC